MSIIIFFTALIATALSAMSGGGASAIVIPALLALGIPFPLATSAQKVSSMIWVLPASFNYLRDRKVDWFFLGWFSLIGLIGVYLGVRVVLMIPERIVELVVGSLILILVAYVLLQKEVGLVEKTVPSALRQKLAYFFAPVLGFYESFFGSGNGILFSIVTLKTRGFDFVDALGYYFAVAFLWEVLAVILFATQGYVSWEVMVPLAMGSLVGGFIGSRYAKYKGNRFIKFMFAVIGTILGLKLLIGL